MAIVEQCMSTGLGMSRVWQASAFLRAWRGPVDAYLRGQFRITPGAPETTSAGIDATASMRWIRVAKKAIRIMHRRSVHVRLASVVGNSILLVVSVVASVLALEMFLRLGLAVDPAVLAIER